MIIICDRIIENSKQIDNSQSDSNTIIIYIATNIPKYVSSW